MPRSSLGMTVWESGCKPGISSIWELNSPGANADTTPAVTGASAIKTLMPASEVLSAFALKRRRPTYERRIEYLDAQSKGLTFGDYSPQSHRSGH